MWWLQVSSLTRFGEPYEAEPQIEDDDMFYEGWGDLGGDEEGRGWVRYEGGYDWGGREWIECDTAHDCQESEVN